MVISLIYMEKENRTLAYAASEAKKYLRRMLPGAEVSVAAAEDGAEAAASGRAAETGETPESGFVISLEIRSDSATRNDHFDIRTGSGGGYIAGNNARSVLIGVYYYLYLLGCRFLGPGKELELVPELTDAGRLSQSYSHTASYYHRGVCIEGSESLQNALDFIDWLPKLGYNTCFIQFQIPYTFFARWYRHEGNPLLAPEEFTAQDAARFSDMMTEELKKRDLLLQMVGHGWTGESIGIPSMDWKASDIRISGKQRSMLAQVDGKREFFHGIPMNTNLCYSNPDVVEAFSESAVRYAATHPGVDYLHVWLADECNNLCECEECVKDVPTDQYIRILNVIDEKLTAKGLDTRIVFLLYQELLWPPVKETLRNPDRFVLMFAPISRSFNSAYQLDGELPPVPAYERNHITLPVNLSQNLAHLRAWQKHFDGDGFVYDYHLGRAHYGDFGYIHISRIIHDDVVQLGKLGLDGQISCQEFRAGMPNFLPNYMMGRMLLDAERGFDEVTEEYYRAAYGDGWKTVLGYLSELSELCDCDYFNRKGPRTNPDIAARMDKARRLTESFAKSEYFSTEPACGLQARFREMLRYHCTYIPYLEKAMCELASGQTEAAKESWMRFIDTIRENELSFQPYLDVYRIYEVSLNYAGFKQYCGCGGY